VSAPPDVQPKLQVGAVDDPLEHETDRIADRVMRMPEKGLWGETRNSALGSRNHSSAPGISHEVLGSPGHPLDATSPSFMKPRFGHDFSKIRVHWDARAAGSARDVNARAYTIGRDVLSGAGQFVPGTTPQAPTGDTQPTPMQNPPAQAPTGDTQPTPMQKSSAKGPAITVTNGWANPAGKTDRTTVGIGEQSSFVVSDVEGGSWKSADGTGSTVNSVTFQWTASTAGTNKITYTAADKTTSSVTMITEVPKKLSGKKDKDLSYPAGTEGAGMDLTVTVSPTTVSFQALELMEDTCDASAISGYFSSHAPGPHDAAAGAGQWNQVGPANDVTDKAEQSGWPSPWSKGSFTWAIPVSWRTQGSKTSTAFSATNDQVTTIGGTDGTTTVTKLGAKTAPRKP
jgi:hypothetical protein